MFWTSILVLLASRAFPFLLTLNRIGLLISHLLSPLLEEGRGVKAC